MHEDVEILKTTLWSLLRSIYKSLTNNFMNRPILLISICIMVMAIIVMATNLSLKVLIVMFIFSVLLALTLALFNYVTEHKYDDLKEENS